MKQLILTFTALTVLLMGCNKETFLAKKPSTSIVQPKTLTDFMNLLDNTVVLNFTGGLAQLSADEYEVSYEAFMAGTETERNAYLWQAQIYNGDNNILDWNRLYAQIFYANNVLEGLSRSDSVATAQGQFIKGWALFTRAFAYYDLAKNFCSLYNPSTASNELGLPLKLKPQIDEILPRASLADTYHQIFQDLDEAKALLPAQRPNNNLNRPSKIATYALLARIYLDIRQYDKAEQAADSALFLYNKLIDYNTVSRISATPFSITHDELIYNTSQVNTYFFTTASAISPGRVRDSVMVLYDKNDLRVPLYFNRTADGTYSKKRGYNGAGGYPFTGLATDELYLIKAECLARRNEISSALDWLSALLEKRYEHNVVPSLIASSAEEALQLVLTERQKELIWRGLRWQDLKRLNAEGANITLSRTTNGQTYTLPPNSPRYAFPIPDDEIALSGIEQNKR
jgi:starch-binding outer membrane protein, SusD/RagB family